jgi:hypothetical protein
MHQQKARPISEPVLGFFCFFVGTLASGSKLLREPRAWYFLGFAVRGGSKFEGLLFEHSLFRAVLLERISAHLSFRPKRAPAGFAPAGTLLPLDFFINFFRSNESVSQYGSYLAEPRLMAGCSLRTNENA